MEVVRFVLRRRFVVVVCSWWNILGLHVGFIRFFEISKVSSEKIHLRRK